MNIKGYKYDQGAKNVDNNTFLEKVQKHYGTVDIKKIEKKLKADVKNPESFQVLLFELDYSKEEFVYNMVCVFRDLFNNSLINHVKGYLQK